MAPIQARTRRKPGPAPQPPELRKTRKVGLTEAAFAKMRALRGSARHPGTGNPWTGGAKAADPQPSSRVSAHLIRASPPSVAPSTTTCSLRLTSPRSPR